MKKLALLVLVALMASSLLAAALPGKLVRLEVINNSGYPVYMRLEGQIYGQFYYLTIPDGEDMTFTIMADVYKRQTWACDGIKSSGDLVMMSQLRLNFTPCFRWNWKWQWVDIDPTPGVFWVIAGFKNNGGEPTQEKVTYFKYISTDYVFWWSCGWYIFSTKTYKTPVGCLFRYQY